MRPSCDTQKAAKHEHQVFSFFAEVKGRRRIAKSIRNIIPVLVAVLNLCTMLKLELLGPLLMKGHFREGFSGIIHGNLAW